MSKEKEKEPCTWLEIEEAYDKSDQPFPTMDYVFEWLAENFQVPEPKED